MALVYGGVQLRQLSRTSDVLVRDSITLTQHTQVLFQDITAMERAANLYARAERSARRQGLRVELHGLQPDAARNSPTTCPETDIDQVRAAGEASAVPRAGDAQPDCRHRPS